MDASSLYKSSLQTKPKDSYHALLIGQYGSDYYPDKEQQEESLRELYLLCDTAGITHMIDLFYHIPAINPRIFFTEGLLQEIKEFVKREELNLLVVDAALKPAQLRNLEEDLKVQVVGRIELILDIFAMRARTKASALQVELAQLTYILPRLKGLGGVLSRQGGGIGTRGPGETMLETDRRHIRRRIQKIQKELESVSKHRANTRKNRDVPTFALVGYTNAGKSTFLNRLSSSSKKVFAEDRLFATLDSFSRQVYLGQVDYKPFYGIITDTVGFIRNLPASLVAAFNSTLEEITYTDAIIIVLDASSSQLEAELEVVYGELERLSIDDKPTFIYLNKEDLIMPALKERLSEKYPDAIWGSSLSKEGVQQIREKLLDYALNTWLPRKKAASISTKYQLY